MSKFNSVFREIDPEDVERLMSHNKDKKRKQYIRNFLLNSYYNNYSNLENSKDIFLIKNSFKFFKLAIIFGLVVGYLSHEFFFTGIYEIRSFYLNPKTIPLPIKLLFTLGISYGVFNYLWMDYVCVPDIYELALKNSKLN